MKKFQDFLLGESAKENGLADQLEAALLKLKIDVNQVEANNLMLSSYTITVKASGANIRAEVRDFDDKVIKKLSGGIQDVAKQIAAIKGINEGELAMYEGGKPDLRNMAKRGQWGIERDQFANYQKGDLIDYYDSNGDKHQGKITSINFKSITIQNAQSKTRDKFDVVGF